MSADGYDRRLRGALVAFIDTETTGTGKDARIVELGVVLVDLMEGEPLVHTSQLIDPQMPIPWQASDVHGIYDGDVRGKPLWPEVWPRLRALLEEGAIPCAYNATFDSRILRQENARCGLEGMVPHKACWLDPFPLVRRMDPKRWRLQDACDRRGIPRGGHRATTDATATAYLLQKMIVEVYRRDDLRSPPPRHPSVSDWLAWQNGKATQPPLPIPEPKRSIRPPAASKARSAAAWSKISGTPRTREGHPVCRYCAELHPKPRYLIYTREAWGSLVYDAPCVYCGSSCAGNRWGATKHRPDDTTGKPSPLRPGGPARRGRRLADLARGATETSPEHEADA